METIIFCKAHGTDSRCFDGNYGKMCIISKVLIFYLKNKLQMISVVKVSIYLTFKTMTRFKSNQEICG